MVDSMILADQFELLGGGVSSQIPECLGAQFRLGQGWDGGVPVPTVDITAVLSLDGEIELGSRASNRLVTLPIVITAPNRVALISAREMLMRAINQPTWTMTWLRDQSTIPTLFDCQRAHPTAVTRSLPLETYGIACLITVQFPAKPYGRSAIPQVVDFTSPLAGRPAPPSQVVIDSFSSVSGTYWTQNTSNYVVGPNVAYYSPFAIAGNAWDVTWHGTGAIASPGVQSGAILGLTAGKKYQGAAWFYSPQGGVTVSVALQWLTSGGGAISTSTGPAVAIPAGAPVFVSSGTLTAPATTAQAKFTLQINGTPAATVIMYAAAGPSCSGYLSQGPITWSSFNSATVTTLSAWTANAQLGNGAGLSASYSVSGLALDLTGLSALSLWVGFASPTYFATWAKKGGPVRFTFTLTDNLGDTISFSITKTCTGSNNIATPKWIKIRVNMAVTTAFNFGNVVAYSIAISNRGTNDLQYAQMFLDTLVAVPTTSAVPSPQRGVTYDLAGVVGTARSPIALQFQQVGSATFTQTLNVPGSKQWFCPFGVTTVSVFAIGAGGDGSLFIANGGGGGGGGGSAFNGAVGVTYGNLYNYTIGAFGTNGGNGGDTIFTGDTVTVTAHGGHGAGSSSTGASGGAAGTGGFAGGTGGAGVATSTGGGGAGGGSAGSAANGNTGGAASGANGGVPATVVTGGGIGGRGGTHNVGNGAAPISGYGGGGGGSPPGFGRRTYGGFGQGVIILVYTQTGAAATLIAHRPRHDAPETLCPFVSMNVQDVPNGGIEYPLTSLVPTLNARFDGTYTIIAVNNSWDAPSTSRNIFVTVKQYQSPGAAAITQSTISLAVIPNNLDGPFVNLGELTLPSKEIPHDNTATYYTVTITDSDVNDTFLDILFLDTMGSTVTIQANAGYGNYYYDEALDNRDIGFIMASLFDRTDAVSILDQMTSLSGPPLSVEPYGNQVLFVYAKEGAPSVQMTYFPRWFEDALV